MKRDIQQKLLDEYNAVSERCESYWEFLLETNRQDERLQALRRSLGLSGTSAK
jgi:hypothetical protein